MQGYAEAGEGDLELRSRQVHHSTLRCSSPTFCETQCTGHAEEGVRLEAGAMDTLGKVAGGDMRKAITTLQSAVRLRVRTKLHIHGPSWNLHALLLLGVSSSCASLC